eukprot:TRINITY_DN64066_c0_g1_i1.p1 TRINITY_DN64066_c0_g1~~TRINITY_DN64066_c0_g1_i1.p1  ORF type:complete len:271 (-),score=56.33 TRINITY_DN64066_c0_g1_i1:52-864(-)
MPPAPPVDVQDDNEVLAFHCNFMEHAGKPCARRTDSGYLTSCSHLFCDEHAKSWFASHVDCPLCKDGGAVRIVKVDFSRPRRQVDLAMVGFSPEEILQAASEAFGLYSSQKMLEHDWQTEAGLRLKACKHRLQQSVEHQLDRARTAYEGLSQQNGQLKEELRKAQFRRGRLQDEVGKAGKRLAELDRSCAHQGHTEKEVWSEPKIAKPAHLRRRPLEQESAESTVMGSKLLSMAGASCAVPSSWQRSMFSMTPGLLASASGGRRQRRRLL